MAILLAFAPFILFAIVESLVGVNAGLVAAAIVACALLARDVIIRGHSPKVLEVGTFVLFAGLAALALLTGAHGSLYDVRLRVDGGLMAIVLISIALRRPFTLQYAREQVPRDLWDQPLFIRTNYFITAAWALAFALMVAADLTLVYVPDLPAAFGIAVTIVALAGAWRFTSWYPNRVRARVTAQAGGKP